MVTMNLSFDPKLSAELEALAKDLGQSTEALVTEMVRATLSDKKLEAKVARARADIAAGRVVEHEDMKTWLESWGKKDEREPPPCE